jgi:hypothetical protein
MTYLSTVLADAPLHYWRLADGQSYIAHDIGATPRHLPVNSPVTAGGYSGIEAGGGSMVGFTLVNLIDLITTTNSGSLECWVYAMDLQNGLEAAIVLFGPSGVNGDFQIFILANGKPFGRAAAVGVTAAGAMSVDIWHHLVVTYNGAATTLYVDGVSQGATASVGGTGHNAQVMIGMLSNAGAEPFRGFIAEVAYYNFALSAARVLAHFNAATPTVPVTGLISSYSTATGSGVLPGSAADIILRDITKNLGNTP